MNKEEKEAIEYIKAFQKDLYGASSKNLMAIYLDRIWNYIDKLQKEFNDLELAYGLYKDRYETLQKENEELKEKYENINWYFENQKDNFVHKNKIRAKIKELEKDIETHSIYEENWNKIEVLKELLGDE